MHLADFRKLVEQVVAGAHQEEAARVWLDLTNGESLSLSFEHMRDDKAGETCTMRVRQTYDECSRDDECQVDLTADSSSSSMSVCRDIGCVAVRWNLRTSEGVLVDLFKAQKGNRIGCDLSSADDPSVKWGELMLRVVDDVASLLRCRHVYLADESSVPLVTWDARAQRPQTQPVMLKYLKPLLDGVGYYEPRGYYTVPRRLYYGFNQQQQQQQQQHGDELGDEQQQDEQQQDEVARAAAAAELAAFDAVRTAHFRGGQLASAIAAIRNDVCGQRLSGYPHPKFGINVLHENHLLLQFHHVSDRKMCVLQKNPSAAHDRLVQKLANKHILPTAHRHRLHVLLLLLCKAHDEIGGVRARC